MTAVEAKQAQLVAKAQAAIQSVVSAGDSQRVCVIAFLQADDTDAVGAALIADGYKVTGEPSTSYKILTITW